MGQSPDGNTINESSGTIFYQGRTDFGFRYPNVRLFTLAPKRMAKEDDILLSVRAPVGDVNVAMENCCIGRGLAAISSNYKHFVFYSLLAQQSDFDVYNNTGTIFGSINREALRHIVDILGSIDEKIENNEQLINIFENLAAKKYLDFANKTSTKIRLEDVIELFDSKRIPLSSREREQRKGIYPYYGATGILDYVNGFLFSGEYVLFAEDGTVTDTNGHPIVQLVNGSFWVNNHAHILKGKNGWNDYSLYVALKPYNE